MILTLKKRTVIPLSQEARPKLNIINSCERPWFLCIIIFIEWEVGQWMKRRIIDYLYCRLAAANSEALQVCSHQGTRLTSLFYETSATVSPAGLSCDPCLLINIWHWFNLINMAASVVGKIFAWEQRWQWQCHTVCSVNKLPTSGLRLQPASTGNSLRWML